MAAIPGTAYLIIGGVVAFASHYLSNDNLNLNLFFWIGLAFIIIGVFKTILGFITKMPKAGKGEDFMKATLKPIGQGQEPKDKSSMYPKYCPSCKLLYTNESNFCSKCGSKLFIKRKS